MAEEKKKKKNPDTKSGRTYSLADFAAGKFSLDDAIKDTKFNKREGVIRSVDKKDPKKTEAELESILRGSMSGGQPRKKATDKTAAKKERKKGFSGGGKVRGAGIARKGVRPAKMF